MMYGNQFLRPFETFHVTTRKFLEQELFKSDQHEAMPLSRLNNKCFVMSAKDYFKMKPEGYTDKDIYVCESRYSTKLRAFKKIKNWPFMNNTLLVSREAPLEPKRVMSVYKERVEKHKGELAELAEKEALVEKEKPVIYNSSIVISIPFVCFIALTLQILHFHQCLLTERTCSHRTTKR